VALIRTAGRPWHAHREMVERAGSVRAALERALADEAGEAPPLPGLQPSNRRDAEALVSAALEDIARWERSGLTLLTVLDDGYPHNLRLVWDQPPLIFVAGRLREDDWRSVAVIGSRHASQAGIRAAGELAEHLVALGWTVISGLAAGIDTAAHRAALVAGGRTIAVVGTGLWRTYPPQNADLQRLIAARCAVVSQFWPDSPPSRHSFPQRNATMSGLARASVIVEASERSGARVQARQALAHGRPVFLSERLLAQRWARDLQARPGVHVYREPADVTRVLGRLGDGELRG